MRPLPNYVSVLGSREKVRIMTMQAFYSICISHASYTNISLTIQQRVNCNHCHTIKKNKLHLLTKLRTQLFFSTVSTSSGVSHCQRSAAYLACASSITRTKPAPSLPPPVKRAWKSATRPRSSSLETRAFSSGHDIPVYHSVCVCVCVCECQYMN